MGRLLLMWRDVKNFKFQKNGIKNLIISGLNKRVIIDAVSIYGWCQADIKEPFTVNIEVFIKNEWVSVLGLSKILDSDFNNNITFPFQLKCDPGNDVDPRVRVKIQNKSKKNFELNVICICNDI